MDKKDAVDTYNSVGFTKYALKEPLSKALAETELGCDKVGRHLHRKITSKEI